LRIKIDRSLINIELCRYQSAFSYDAAYSRLCICQTLKKTLLPVALLGVIHQAATLARHFRPEIVILNVLIPLSQAAGVPEDTREQADWDLLAAIIRQAQKHQSLGPELAGITIQRRLGTVDTAVAIMQTAQDQKADLIIMPAHSFTFYEFHGP
jgi:nucleotide-binding universal stress UspA family protein